MQLEVETAGLAKPANCGRDQREDLGIAISVECLTRPLNQRIGGVVAAAALFEFNKTSGLSEVDLIETSEAHHKPWQQTVC